MTECKIAFNDVAEGHWDALCRTNLAKYLNDLANELETLLPALKTPLFF